MKNLFSHDFVHIKILYKLENQSKIDQKKKVENIRYNYTICVTQQVLKMENGKCFGRVLLFFLKCLLMATTRDKTVG